MRAVFRPARHYIIVLACAVVALAIAAETNSLRLPQSGWILWSAFPAFALELAFFLAATLESTRARFACWGTPMVQAFALWISALAPYLLFSGITGTFHVRNFALLVFLTGLLSFWNVVLPRSPVADLGFLALAAAPMVARLLPQIYESPDPHLRVDFLGPALGHATWFRIGIVALLVLRRWDAGPFSLWPRLCEWRIGVICYLLAVGPISAMALAVHAVRFSPLQKDPMVVVFTAVTTFFGILWGVALGEDLFFQGVVTRALVGTWNSWLVAITVSAILFGTVHLWVHGFPNWRWAIVVTVLGFACGAAYAKTGSVRAPMVTHAFVVTTWRLLFS
ncbi:MAG: CPBP family intramembrane glutamic endopeptidase [Bryobacteraceae bacterium]